MKGNSTNYIRATIVKIKIPTEIDIHSFILRMEFCKQIQETEKLSGKDIELKKSFFFEFLYDLDDNVQHTNLNFEISAFSKTLLIFDSQIGKLSFQLNPSKLIDRKEWFSLKNSNEVNTIMVLISIADMREKIQLTSKEISSSENQFGINNLCFSNYSMNNKIKKSTRINRTHINKPYSADSNINFNICNKPNILINASNNKFIANSNPKLNLNLLNHNNKTKSGVLLISSHSIKSIIHTPTSNSHRQIIKSDAISNSALKMVQLKNPLKGDETGFLTTHESGYEQNDWLADELNKDSNSQSNNSVKINISTDEIKFKNNCNDFFDDESEKLKKMRLKLKENRKKLKSYELNLLKENESLEQKIRAFNLKRNLYEKKYLIFNSNFNKLENLLTNARLKRDLVHEDKVTFFKLNLMIKSNSLIDYNLNRMNKCLSNVYNNVYYDSDNIEANLDKNNSDILLMKKEKEKSLHFEIYNNRLNCERLNDVFKKVTQNMRTNKTNNNKIYSYASETLFSGGNGGIYNYSFKSHILSNNDLKLNDKCISSNIGINYPICNVNTTQQEPSKFGLNLSRARKSLSNKKETSVTQNEIIVISNSHKKTPISNVCSSKNINKENLDSLRQLNYPNCKNFRISSHQTFKKRTIIKHKSLHTQKNNKNIKIAQIKENNCAVNIFPKNKILNCNVASNGDVNNFQVSEPLINKNSSTNSKFKKEFTVINHKIKKEITGSLVKTPIYVTSSLIPLGNKANSKSKISC